MKTNTQLRNHANWAGDMFNEKNTTEAHVMHHVSQKPLCSWDKKVTRVEPSKMWTDKAAFLTVSWL